jgi:hypothetical protein
MNRPRIALTIAGSDPGGGAGLQADLTTFTRLGVHGATAITAITVQDTRDVLGFDVLPSHRIVEQIEVTLADLPVAGDQDRHAGIGRKRRGRGPYPRGTSPYPGGARSGDVAGGGGSSRPRPWWT